LRQNVSFLGRTLEKKQNSLRHNKATKLHHHPEKMKLIIATVSLLGLVASNATVFEHNNIANQAVTAATRAKGIKKPSAATKGSKVVSKSSEDEDCRGAKAKSGKTCNPSSEPSTNPSEQPSFDPSSNPSSNPSENPSRNPSSNPSSSVVPNL
jgi:hypothetical protein